MNNSIPIPGHEKETVLINTRRHFVAYLGRLILIAVLFLIPILIFSYAYSTYPNMFNGSVINFVVVIGSIYYLVMSTFAFISWISYYFNIFIVTDQSIIDVNQEGIFNRQITEVSILRVQDVSAKIKGVFPTLFGYGDVVAETAGENTRTYVIDSIPNPIEVANKILSLHTDQIKREERSDEAIVAEGDFRSQKTTPYQQSLRGTPVIQPPQSSTRFICEPEIKSPEPKIEGEPFRYQEAVKNDILPNVPVEIVNQSQDDEIDEGKISKDDLNKGGEIKF